METFYQSLHGLWTLLHIIKEEKLEGRLLLFQNTIYSLQTDTRRGSSNPIHLTPSCSDTMTEPALAGSVDLDHYQPLKVCKDGAKNKSQHDLDLMLRWSD